MEEGSDCGAKRQEDVEVANGLTLFSSFQNRTYSTFLFDGKTAP
jgi:hypothetical protein